MREKREGNMHLLCLKNVIKYAVKSRASPKDPRPKPNPMQANLNRNYHCGVTGVGGH